jgi:hypothetical protein
MITAQRLNTYVLAEPFRAFRISMASGQALEIRHPEMISVGRTTASITFTLSEDPELAKEGVREVSLVLMESVEPLDRAATTGKRRVRR